MLKKLNILLVLISVSCSLFVMQAADQFKGLDEKRYNAPIIVLLYAWHNELKAESAFRNIEQHDRVRHMRTLFTMFADENIRTRSCRLSDVDTYRGACHLLRIANTFNLFEDAQVREAFFDVSYNGNLAMSMLSGAVEDSGFPVEKIKAWFPEKEKEKNKQRMLISLNGYTTHVRDDIVERMKAICEHIGFDQWDKVAPRARYAFNETIHEKDTQNIKEFLRAYGVEFSENPAQDLENIRMITFIDLIKKCTKDSKRKALLSIANFLADNRHIFLVSESMEKSLLGIHEILKKQEKTFELELKLFCSYVLSLRLGYGKRGADPGVNELMHVSCILPDEQFAQACQMLVSEEDYPLFLKRSGRALEKYIEAAPCDPQQVRKTVAQAKDKPVNIDEAVSSELGRRLVARARIHRLLNAHALEKTLFEMLLMQCAADLWSEQSDAETSGASPYSCSSGN